MNYIHIISFIIFQIISPIKTQSQFIRVDLWNDSIRLDTTAEMNDIKFVQIFDASTNEGELVSEKYLNNLKSGIFKEITLFRLSVNKRMLSLLGNVKTESIVFNNCKFEDSSFLFTNKHVLYLVLSGGNIKCINNSIRKMNQLKALSVMTSSIRKLPKCIFKFKQLNFLDLTGCQIENLDDVLVKNKQLKILKMMECNLKYKDVYRIPAMLSNLEELELDIKYEDCIRFKKENSNIKYITNVCNVF